MRRFRFRTPPSKPSRKSFSKTKKGESPFFAGRLLDWRIPFHHVCDSSGCRASSFVRRDYRAQSSRRSRTNQLLGVVAGVGAHAIVLRRAFLSLCVSRDFGRPAWTRRRGSFCLPAKKSFRSHQYAKARVASLHRQLDQRSIPTRSRSACSCNADGFASKLSASNRDLR